MRGQLSLLSSVLLFSILIGPQTGSGVAAHKKPTPPSAQDLVGVWIGFDKGELDFSRLELHPDSTGSYARLAPADIPSTGFFARAASAGVAPHGYGVRVYRITKWTVDGWNFVVTLAPISSNAENVYLKGLADWRSLRLEVGGTKVRWKNQLVLYRESQIVTSNQEAKASIEQAAKK